MNPKVFISHASEDKKRFVEKFAAALLAKGIDAWLDKWEILPGDSLVDRIFEEGIKGAQAIIVVVSNCSVNKPWVKEELNAAVVKKINGISKVIPVVIDECQVPEALQSTLWVRVKDLDNYEAELDRIVMAIYNYREKPLIGSPPAYAQTVANFISGLTNTDNLVFKLFCDKVIENEWPQLGRIEIFEIANSLSIPIDEFKDTLQILHNRGYIEGIWTADGTIWSLSVTISGFEAYAKVYIKDYNAIVQAVIFQFMNHDNTHNEVIAKAVNQPLIIVNYALWSLDRKGLIKVVSSTGGVEVTGVSPELKRKLRNSR